MPAPIPDPLYDPALDEHVPEMERIAALVAEMQGESPEVWTEKAITGARANFEAYSTHPPEVTDRFVDRQIDGPHGPIRLRTHVPDGDVRGVVLDWHGGGFFLGRPEMDDVLNLRLAAATRTVVVSASYRLGPEAPYPAGPDDAEATALWVLENASAEWGVPLRAVMGSSAGANIAAGALVRLRDKHDALGAIEAANMVYGVFDMRGTPSQYERGIPSFRDLYLPDVERRDRDHVDMSPIFADLRDMPPALFTVGTADYLFDDSLFMAARWHAAGGEAQVAAYPACPHGFNAYPAELSRIANDTMDQWLCGVLDRVES
ncbi:MAG: alpha/beta hydrolase [Acidimicrobiales bacterium]|nr:alpha/beta hydrolase [Acidimicrobiales bacterium]